MRRRQHFAEISFDEEENEDGRMQDCVYAACVETGSTVGPIWGHSDASVKRALATLSVECEGYHVQADA